MRQLQRIINFVVTAILLAVGIGASAQTPKLVSDTLANRVELHEVIVRPGKEHYSKRNNPAVDFMERIRKSSALSDPNRRDNYNFKKYERIVLALNNVQDTLGNLRGLLKQLPFLAEFTDTSVVNGLMVLPISVKEKVSEVYHQRSPEKTREYVTGIKRNGVTDIGNKESIQSFLEDVFRDIDLYQNDITLLGNRFVSPLSHIAADFYKFYLSDTVRIDSDTCVVLSFAPRNNATFGFVGRLYVPANDTAMVVKRVDMTLSKNANVNFVESLRITQQFDRDTTGCRLKTLDDLAVEFAIISGTQGVYARKYTTYTDHNFDPSPRPDLFNRLGQEYIAADSYLKDDEFWASVRDETYRPSHSRVADLSDRLHAMPAYYWTERVLKVVVSGYIPITAKDKFEYGPVNTTVSFSDVEGVRLRFGGLSTANFSPHWFFRAYGAYGTKDHRWKYYGEAEYSFNAKKRHSREFPMRSIRASYRNDIHAIGQDYAFTNADNIFISFKRMNDTVMIYNRTGCLEYIHELDNHLSWNVAIEHQRQEPSRYIGFHWADGTSAPHLDFTTARISLRFAPGEKFIQTKSNRVPVNVDNWTVQLTHTYGPANTFGSGRYVVNRTEMDLRKRFWFSAFGYLDFIAKGGHVWSTSPYTQLLVPNANLTYTVQPESFALLNPMEFVTDTYASLDLTYWANGAILNYIPLLKKLKWREAFSFRSYWGRLSDKNNPELNPWLPQFPVGANPVAMGRKPYMEMGVGIDNIFKILRVDYVWRLTYRSTPGADRHGVRIALHFAF